MRTEFLHIVPTGKRGVRCRGQRAIERYGNKSSSALARAERYTDLIHIRKIVVVFVLVGLLWLELTAPALCGIGNAFATRAKQLYWGD